MKKSILLLFIAFQTIGFSQETNDVKQVKTSEKILKNEIDLNLGMIFLGLPEITYERIFADNQSVSVSAAISLRNEMDHGIKYMISSQYRLYFGKKRANGFFMEFGTSFLEKRSNNNYYYYEDYLYNSIYIPRSERVTQFGIGIGAGVKLLTKNNLVGEFKLGCGSNLLQDNLYYEDRIYPRLGFSIGKRF